LLSRKCEGAEELKGLKIVESVFKLVSKRLTRKSKKYLQKYQTYSYTFVSVLVL